MSSHDLRLQRFYSHIVMMIDYDLNDMRGKQWHFNKMIDECDIMMREGNCGELEYLCCLWTKSYYGSLLDMSFVLETVVTMMAECWYLVRA